MTLLLLVAAGAVIFFFGWIQYLVPVGSYGVLRSKTHGTESRVIQHGQFRWVWYKLIPNNAAIAVFSIKENTVSVDFSGMLPSGNTYSALAGLKTDFSYKFAVSCTYRLKPESLPALADSENLLSQAELDSYFSRLSKDIENHIRTLLWALGENETAIEEAQKTGTIEALKKELVSAYSDMEILGCTVETLMFPDIGLYNELKLLYRDYLAAQRADLRETIALMAAENIQNRRRIDELAGYGELLTKYPILIQYLALEKGIQEKSD